MISLRCSRLPLLFACPSSHGVWQRPVDRDTEAAQFGSKVHQRLRAALEIQFAGGQELPMCLESDDEEVDRLVAWGFQAWNRVGHAFGSPACEVPLTMSMPAFTLTGHADVLGESDVDAGVLDWKTGWKAHDYSAQMKGYALGFGGAWREALFTTVIVWLRDRECEVKKYSPEELNLFEGEIEDKIEQIGHVWNPGEHCIECPGVNECQARRDSLSVCALALAGDRKELVPADLVRMHGQAQMLQAALDRFNEELRTYIDLAGPLRMDETHELRLVGQVITEIDAKRAWPILEEAFTPDELARVVRIVKGEMQRALWTKTSGGQKTRVLAELMRRLKAAGATRERTQRQLRIVAIKKADGNA